MSHAPLFTVTDPIELLALWRLVAEAKFSPDPTDGDLWGSPYVHLLATRISRAILADHQARGDVAAIASHEQWLDSLANNTVLPIIQAQLKKDASWPWWHEQSAEQKLQYVRGCIAPFRAEPEMLQRLIQEAEA